MGADEPNAVVQLDGEDDEPNVRATTLALREGLSARSVNCWPGVGFDLGAIGDRLSPLLPAGFYYKTFMGLPGGWNFYGRYVRRMAGLGTAPRTAGRRAYERRFSHCDVLVAGAGPAGLRTALAAARGGARVMIADDGVAPGGTLLDAAAEIGDRPAAEWVGDAVAELDAFPNVVRLEQATVAGYYDHNLLTVVELSPAQSWIDERLWKVRARRVVLATGASERPLVFANNDRPGVMLASAALAYVRRYGVRPGDRAVAVTNNNATYRAVLELVEAGVEVPVLVDLRTHPPEPLVGELAARGVEVRSGHAVVGVAGTRTVAAAFVAPTDQLGERRRVDCDLVLCSGGWSPRVHLHSQSGGRPAWDEARACFVPGRGVQAERSAGACNGAFGLRAALEQGWRAGSRACAALGFLAPATDVLACRRDWPLDIEPCWEIPTTRPRAKAFVDLQNDVTAADIRLAEQEGFRSVEHVKRYTTAGMGTDQGKLGNVNAIGILSETLGEAPGAVGTTTYRPPYAPVSFGVIAGKDAGEIVLPSRRTALTDWIEDAGAVMFEAGRRGTGGRASFRVTVSAWRRPSRARRSPAGPPPACTTARRSASSSSTVRTWPSFSTGSMRIDGTTWPSVVAGSAGCCARTAGSWTTESPSASPRTAGGCSPVPGRRITWRSTWNGCCSSSGRGSGCISPSSPLSGPTSACAARRRGRFWRRPESVRTSPPMPFPS